MRIYVAGPMTAETAELRLQNVHRAMDVALGLFQKGHDPVVPHLSFFLDEFAKKRGVTIPYEWWIRTTQDLMLTCDALFYIAPSPGADREQAIMAQLGRPTFTELIDVPDAAHHPLLDTEDIQKAQQDLRECIELMERLK